MTSQVGIGPGHRVLGRYELVRYVDSGGAGTVWEAHDHTLGQTVALKHVTFPAATPAQREEADQNRARTLREARFAAQLRNRPHVVGIYDVQEVDGDVWLVLEYLPSHSLRGMLARVEALDPVQAARIGAAVASALASAHAEGITHRDVKPGNVLLGDDGRTVKLTDFGIAHSDREQGLTSTGVVSGTPAYMAPEQARGEDCTPASDVFSLGATLYRAVEGAPPYGDDENQVALMHRVAYRVPHPPQRASAFAPLLMSLLEPEPTARPDAATASRRLDDFARSACPGGSAAVTGPPADAPPAGSQREVATLPPTAAPPAPARGWWRRHRVALAALGAVVALGVAAGAVVLTGALRSDPNAVPALPDQVRPIAMTGDPVAADPCALIDPAVMSRFGTVRVGPGADTGECRVTATEPDGRRTQTDVYYSDAAAEATGSAGPVRRLGALSIIPAGVQTEGCTTYLRLADSTLVGVATRDGSPDGRRPVNRCDATDAAVAVAVHRLDDAGITYAPGWQGPISLAGKNACGLVGDAGAAIPGLDAQRRNGPPNGSSCDLGVAGPGASYARIRLGLEPDGTLAGYGPMSTVGTRTLHTRSVPGFYSPTACQVYVVHRPYDTGARRPAEFVSARLEGPQPYDQLCGGATALALQAERNAG